MPEENAGSTLTSEELQCISDSELFFQTINSNLTVLRNISSQKSGLVTYIYILKD